MDPATATRLRPGTYAKSAATRQAILDAAGEVFAKRGFNGGSLRQVADIAGITEAGILHHYPNKAALLAALLLDHDKAFATHKTRAVGDPRAVLRGIVDVAAANALETNTIELFSILSAEATAPGHPGHEHFARHYVRMTAVLTDVLTALHTAGHLHEHVRPASAARNAVAVWDGLQTQWLFQPESVDISRGLRDYFDLLLVEPL